MEPKRILTLRTGRVGIWGFGIVGKATAQALHNEKIKASLLEQKPLTNEELEMCEQLCITPWPKTDPDEFLKTHDWIIAAPGIDLRPWKIYREKFITELDLLQDLWSKEIIAITGTVGKTTTTHLLEAALTNHNHTITTGGNIGIGMLSLPLLAKKSELLLLEVSSFQLELCKTFHPTISIWTNLYPNHLDRHGTIDEYFEAKFQIIARQTAYEHALIPAELYSSIKKKNPMCKITYYSTTSEQASEFLNKINDQESVLWPDKKTNKLRYQSKNRSEVLINLNEIPEGNYEENWHLVICALFLYHGSVDAKKLQLIKPDRENTLAHRLELVTTDAIFPKIYNDSKSTVPEATLRAIKAINSRDIVLMLGGVSKGVDRTSLIAALPDSVKHVICFGKEATILANACSKFQKSYSSCATLEEAIDEALKNATHRDAILFSPSGASYDLFTDYKARGNAFKRYINERCIISQKQNENIDPCTP